VIFKIISLSLHVEYSHIVSFVSNATQSPERPKVRIVPPSNRARN